MDDSHGAPCCKRHTARKQGGLLCTWYLEVPHATMTVVRHGASAAVRGGRRLEARSTLADPIAIRGAGRGPVAARSLAMRRIGAFA
jgi:hypothetical protein